MQIETNFTKENKRGLALLATAFASVLTIGSLFNKDSGAAENAANNDQDYKPVQIFAGSKSGATKEAERATQAIGETFEVIQGKKHHHTVGAVKGGCDTVKEQGFNCTPL